jgi:hypothetical protein
MLKGKNKENKCFVMLILINILEPERHENKTRKTGCLPFKRLFFLSVFID